MIFYAGTALFLKEVERWGSSSENIHLSIFSLMLSKHEEMTVFECFVRFTEECEFVKIVITLSLPSELQWHN